MPLQRNSKSRLARDAGPDPRHVASLVAASAACARQRCRDAAGRPDGICVVYAHVGTHACAVRTRVRMDV